MTIPTELNDGTMTNMRDKKAASSTVTNEHESKVVDAPSHLQKEGLECITGGHIEDKCDLNTEDREKAVDNVGLKMFFIASIS